MVQGTQTKGMSPPRSQSKTGTMIFLFLIGSIAIGTAGFYLNTPVPQGLEDPWKYWLMTSIKHFVSDLAHLQEFLFKRPYPITLRNTLDMFTFGVPHEKEGSNILSIVTAIAGVKVRLYEPIEPQFKTDGPALIFIHGGGFFLGSADLWDTIVRRIAEELDIVVVSIDYRLAPENVHPAAFEDCFAVTKWFLQNAKSFHVDKNRVGISGDSAGGTLAAAVAQYIHDDTFLPDLKYQALVYPVSQLLDIETPAQQKYRRHFGENGGLITWWEAAALVSWLVVGKSDDEIITAFMKNNQTTYEFWHESKHAAFVDHNLVPKQFLENDNYDPLPVNRPGNSKVWSQVKSMLLDPRMCPLMRLNMTGLPPAYVATCEFDAMRDNGIYYVKRLMKDGVEVDWKHYNGGFHGVFGPAWPLTFKVGEHMFTDYIKFIKSHW